MNTVFLRLVNMSISAAWLVFAVLLVRSLFRRAPKWVNVLLWGLVALRLVFPFSLESVFSLIPSAETVPLDIEMMKEPAISSGITYVNQVVNPVIGQSAPVNEAASINPMQITVGIMTALWLLGMAAMIIYTVISYLILRHKVGTAVKLRDNIYQSENVGTPFVLGIFRPRIYLPFSAGEAETEHIVAHEVAHIKRRDHLWKPLGFLILSLYWFNPVIWAAYIFLCRDIELACDERVIKTLDSEARADYTQTLLSFSVNRRTIAACPLAFGEVGVKERVRSVMNYKKPAFWVILVSVTVCAVVAVCFLTNPKKKDLKFDIGEASKIVVFSGSTGGQAVLNDSEEIKYITDSINGIEFSKDKASKNRDGFAYSITWYDEKGEKLEGITLMTASRISYDGYFYDASKAAIDMEYFDGMFKNIDGVFLNGYVYHGEWDTASLTLFEDGRCTFVFSLLSSYLGYGGYTEQDGYLVMNTNDNKYTLTFRKEGSDLVFVADRSSEMPSFRYDTDKAPQTCVPDGAVFRSSVKDTVYAKPYLTMETLKDIARSRGEDMTWSDFSGYYNSGDIGSGLYILRYPIADRDDIYLFIGGAGTAVKPMYINLVSTEDSDKYIDMFTYNFLSSEFVFSERNKYAYDEYGLRMELRFVSASDFQLIFTHLSEKADESVKMWVSPSDSYTLQIKYGDMFVNFEDYVEKISPRPDPLWKQSTEYLGKDTKTVLDCSLNSYGQYFPAGKYQLCKSVNFETEQGVRLSKTYTAEFEIEEAQTILDKAVFDIDGDGIKEHCTISRVNAPIGYAMEFLIEQDGAKEYCNSFYAPSYEWCFKNDGGELKLCGTKADGVCHTFDVLYDGKDISFGIDDDIVKYWDEHREAHRFEYCSTEAGSEHHDDHAGHHK